LTRDTDCTSCLSPLQHFDNFNPGGNIANRYRVIIEQPQQPLRTFGKFDVYQIEQLVRRGVAEFENDTESTLMVS
jgi:hypothetical protein